MLIDCDRCRMRDIACDECVVSALITERGAPSADHGAPQGAPSAGRGALPARGAASAGGDPPGTGPSGERPGAGRDHQPGAPGPEISEPERRALRTLAAAGLIPPLQLVLPEPEQPATRSEPAGEFPEAEAS